MNIFNKFVIFQNHVKSYLKSKRMRILKHSWLVVLALVLSATTTYAQFKEKRENRRAERQQKKSEQTSYLVLETAATYSNNQDFSTSNQIYRGAGIGLSIGEYKETPNSIRDYEGLGLVNNFISSQGGVSGFDWTIAMNYGHLFILNDGTSNWRIAAGPKVDFLTQVRLLLALGNSAAHWDGMFTAGAAGRVDKTVTLPLIKKSVNFYGEAHLPLVGYLNRPSYGIPGWEVIHQVGYIGKMTRLETEVGIITPFRQDNPNQLRISYNWDFFRFRDNEIYRVITGHHALSIALLVRIR